jgi:hypothetical protein
MDGQRLSQRKTIVRPSVKRDIVSLAAGIHIQIRL